MIAVRCKTSYPVHRLEPNLRHGKNPNSPVFAQIHTKRYSVFLLVSLLPTNDT
jgi:hypothetical protein